MSRRIRPFMVVDTKKRILSDFGAAQQVEGYDVRFNSNLFGLQLNLDLKTHSQNAPIVRTLTAALYLESFDRGEGNSWVYHFRTNPQTEDQGAYVGQYFAGIDTNSPIQFMVEILP